MSDNFCDLWRVFCTDSLVPKDNKTLKQNTTKTHNNENGKIKRQKEMN